MKRSHLASLAAVADTHAKGGFAFLPFLFTASCSADRTIEAVGVGGTLQREQTGLKLQGCVFLLFQTSAKLVRAKRLVFSKLEHNLDNTHFTFTFTFTALHRAPCTNFATFFFLSMAERKSKQSKATPSSGRIGIGVQVLGI